MTTGNSNNIGTVVDWPVVLMEDRSEVKQETHWNTTSPLVINPTFCPVAALFNTYNTEMSSWIEMKQRR